MIIERLTRIMDSGTSSLAREEPGIEAYEGKARISDYQVLVQGSGAWVEGEVKGTVETCDYKALYQVYNLPATESVDVWIFNFRRDRSRSELRKVVEDAVRVSNDYQLKFRLQGNDLGITRVIITYRVLRLTINGQSRDFVITNPASAGASLPNGEKYPGGFKPIG